jgi:hypothetical protein
MSAPAARLSRRNLVRWSPWLGGLLLAIGAGAVLITFFGNTADTSAPLLQTTTPYRETPDGKKVPISQAVQLTAARFIKTAVARRNLAAGWKVTAPELRAGTTFKEWLRGTSSVAPFPVDLRVAPAFRVDESYERRAELEVFLTPRPGSGEQPKLFFIGLKANGLGAKKHWLVYYWNARFVPPVKQTDVNGGS